MAYISKVTLPGGQSFDIKDAEARQLIESLGNAVYWIGVTTTKLTDGGTDSPITVGGDPKTPNLGGMAQYEGEEFIWDGTKWQSVGKNNFGDLAFKGSASASYTPAGTVSKQTAQASTTKATVNSITNVGTLPTFTVTEETLTITAGTLPTKGSDTSVVSDITEVTVTQATFSGTKATITVS